MPIHLTKRKFTRYGSVLLAAAALLWFSSSPATGEQKPYDLVILNGRVMDPESRLDAVRNIAIRNGKIAEISEKPLPGIETVDAKGMIVALPARSISISTARTPKTTT